VRAVIVQGGRLLIVNAYPGEESDLWCAPGGGVERGQSLHDNLMREIREELDLTIAVAEPCLVNEFQDPGTGFHQVDVYFRAQIVAGSPQPGWVDAAGVVNRHRFVTEAALRALRFKPDSLPQVAFGGRGHILYDPLEEIVR